MIEVIHGNCLEIVPTLGKFDLVFVDPPFNIGENYNGYSDNMSDSKFACFVTDVLETLERHTTGILALHGSDKMVDLYLDSMFNSGMTRLAWIIQHYRFGQCNRSNWINAHAHCLIYTHGSHTWNPDAVLVDSDRVLYDDSRVINKGGKRVPLDVWGIPSDGPYWGRVQGNNKERRDGHPNQLPERYLERLIRAYTDPGGSVLDCFGGSGTTAVVAQALGRNCVTVDISESNCASIKERLVKGAVRI